MEKFSETVHPWKLKPLLGTVTVEVLGILEAVGTLCNGSGLISGSSEV